MLAVEVAQRYGIKTDHAGKQDQVHGDIAEFATFTHTDDPA